MLMHLYFLKGNRLLFTVVHRAKLLFKVQLYLLDLATNQNFVLHVLGDIDTHLLKDHYSDQVRRQFGHVTHPVGNDVIRYVSVDELEHVPLVN